MGQAQWGTRKEEWTGIAEVCAWRRSASTLCAVQELFAATRSDRVLVLPPSIAQALLGGTPEAASGPAGAQGPQASGPTAAQASRQQPCEWPSGQVRPAPGAPGFVVQRVPAAACMALLRSGTLSGNAGMGRAGATGRGLSTDGSGAESGRSGGGGDSGRGSGRVEGGRRAEGERPRTGGRSGVGRGAGPPPPPARHSGPRPGGSCAAPPSPPHNTPPATSDNPNLPTASTAAASPLPPALVRKASWLTAAAASGHLGRAEGVLVVERAAVRAGASRRVGLALIMPPKGPDPHGAPGPGPGAGLAGTAAAGPSAPKAAGRCGVWRRWFGGWSLTSWRAPDVAAGEPRPAGPGGGGARGGEPGPGKRLRSGIPSAPHSAPSAAPSAPTPAPTPSRAQRRAAREEREAAQAAACAAAVSRAEAEARRRADLAMHELLAAEEEAARCRRAAGAQASTSGSGRGGSGGGGGGGGGRAGVRRPARAQALALCSRGAHSTASGEEDEEEEEEELEEEGDGDVIAWGRFAGAAGRSRARSIPEGGVGGPSSGTAGASTPGGSCEEAQATAPTGLKARLAAAAAAPAGAAPPPAHRPAAAPCSYWEQYQRTHQPPPPPPQRHQQQANAVSTSALPLSHPHAPVRPHMAPEPAPPQPQRAAPSRIPAFPSPAAVATATDLVSSPAAAGAAAAGAAVERPPSDAVNGTGPNLGSGRPGACGDSGSCRVHAAEAEGSGAGRGGFTGQGGGLGGANPEAAAAVERSSAGTECDLLYSLHTCIVCMEAPRSVVLVPCGHLALCGGCMALLERAGGGEGGRVRCPVCREAVREHHSVG